MKLCVPIKTKRQKEVLRQLEEVAEKADMAEVWLDQIVDLEVATLFKQKPKALPIIATYKMPRDGGGFKGGYAALVERLLEAAEYGAKYIDIPLQMPEKLSKNCVQSARKSGAKIIISHHDFKKTPSLQALRSLAQKIHRRGADVVKIATMARRLEDNLSHCLLAQELKNQNIPHCLVAMGKKGQLSRILTPVLGGEFAFAILHKNRQTAAGQMTVEEMREVWEF